MVAFHAAMGLRQRQVLDREPVVPNQGMFFQWGWIGWGALEVKPLVRRALEEQCGDRGGRFPAALQRGRVDELSKRVRCRQKIDGFEAREVHSEAAGVFEE